MPEERRQHRRQAFQLAVRVRLDSIDQLIDEYARDLSISGMSLRLNHAVAPGEKIYLEFRLQEGEPLISVFAEVKWSVNHDDVHTVGVEFLDLDERGEDFIRQVLVYIEERRLHRRVEKEHTVEISAGSLAQLREAHARDLSLGGAKLLVDQPLKAGTELTLRIRLGQRQSFQSKAKVRWCEPKASGFAIGVEFIELEESSKKFLAGLIGQGGSHNV